MAEKRIVVVGGAGFIGRNTIEPLLKKGYEVHVFDIKSLKQSFSAANWHVVNINESSKVNDLINSLRPTHLLNFAWVTKHGDYWTSEENVECINASFNLLKAFKKHGGKRFVMSGSCAEYDWNSGVCSETKTHLRPNTFYGACKESIWQILRTYSKLSNLSSAWGRIFFTFGPYENTNRLVASVINSLLENKPAKCSHGNQIRDFLSTAEIGKAFVELVDSDVEGAVNIASGNPIALKDIILTIAQKMGGEHLVEFGAIKANKNEPKMIVAEVERLNNEVGWKSSILLEQQLEDTIAWWKEQR